MIARILATVGVVVMFLGLSIVSVESAELAPPVRLMAGGKPIDGRLDLLVGDSSGPRIENSKPIESRSTAETAVLKEAYDKASDTYGDLHQAPPTETHVERIARHRALLRAWQHQDAARRARSGQTESHGNVWFYERLAP